MYKKIALIVLFVFISVFAYADSERDSFLLAENAYKEGLYDTSYKLFESFVQVYPNSQQIDSVDSYMARSLYLTAEYDKAEEKFLRLVKNNDISLRQQSFYYLAMIESQRNDNQKFNEFLKKVITEELFEHPYYYKGLFEYARFNVDQGEYELAVENFREIIDWSTDRELNLSAYISLSELYLRNHDIKGLKRTLDGWEEDPLTLDDSAKFFFYRAKNAELRGEIDRVFHFYARALMFTLERQRKEEIISFLIVSAHKYSMDEIVEKYIGELSEGIDKLYVETQLSYLNGDYASAVQLAEQFLSQGKDKLRIEQIEVLLADSLYTSSRIKDATRHYSIFVAKKDKDIRLGEQANYGLGLCYLKTKDFAKAISTFESLPKDSKNTELRAATFLHVAAGNYELGRKKEAVRIYNDILEDFPRSEYADYALLKMVQISVEENNPDRAVMLSERLDNDYPSSVLKADNIYSRAYAYFMLKEYQLAIENLNSFESLYPLDNGLDQVIFLLLRIYSEMDEFEIGQQHIEKYADKFKEDSAQFIKEQALFYMHFRKYSKAIKLFDSLMSSSDPSQNLSEILFYIAQAYKEQGDDLKAEKLYLKILNNHNQEIDADHVQMSLIEIYIDSGRYIDAEKELLKIIDRTIKKDIILTSLDYLCLIYQTRHDYSSADRVLDKYMLKFPKLSVKITAKKALSAKIRGDFRAAERYLSFVIENGDGDEKMYFNYAFAMEKNDNLQGAIEQYREIIYLHSQSSEYIIKSYLRMAALYVRLNQINKAKDTYRSLIELKVPESSFAQEQLNKLL